MTLPMFAAALDTAAVGAMVSVVGSYTLEALLDSEQRAQHKQQCADRLRVHNGRQVQYSEQAVLANLDWGIDALEEAIRTNNDETKVARLDHAEKMLQVCALLESRATTAGVPNCYLSAWAHFNLAFVWKLRSNDRKAANHMLEMFLVDPLYSRVDFAPALWEHLFLPHLSNIVNWYTKQRQSIVVSGTARKMNEEYEMSISISRDFTAMKDLQVNVLNLSADQTTQLQALEKLYQDSLDENTRQYARYYKDWLNYDQANKRGMPLMPIAEPPMTPMNEVWMSSTYDMPLFRNAEAKPSPASRQKRASSYSPLDSLKELKEFKEFDNPEFVESGLPDNTRNGLQDDPDSPNSNFRKPVSYREDSMNMTMALESILESPNGESPGPTIGSSAVTSQRDRNVDSPQSARRVARASSIRNSESALPKETKVGSMMARSKSGRYHELGLSQRDGTRRFSDVFTKSGGGSPASTTESVSQPSAVLSDGDSSDSFNDLEALITPVREPNLAATESGGSVNTSPSLRFISRYDTAASPEASSFDPDYVDEYDELRITAPSARRVRSTSRRGADSPAGSNVSARDHADDQQAIVGLMSPRHHRCDSLISISSSSITNSAAATPLTRPPKDFVCPITSHLFDDPVTLETGQTYERKAIQEWLNRGNTTCPITRQMLRISVLPKTNFLLKRLVDRWKEQHPELAVEFGCSPLVNGEHVISMSDSQLSRSLSDFMERSPEPRSPSSVSSVSSIDSYGQGRPTRRFSRRFSNGNDKTNPASPLDVDGLIMDLKPALTCLCTSDDLAKCESVVLDIFRLFQEARGDQKMVAFLTKAGVIEGLIEVLSNSAILEVLKATLFILSELIARDDQTRRMVVSADPELECLIGLLRKGLTTSVVVVYQLGLPIYQLTSLDLLPLLVVVIKQNEENRGIVGEQESSLTMRPKSAAIMLLEQIVIGGDQGISLQSAQALLTLQAVPALISSLDARNIEERTSVVSLLLCCMQSDGRSRNMIAQNCSLAPVVELLHSGDNRARTVTISFLADLVRLNRRSCCNDILETVKTEGLLSSTHVLLVHLQMAPLEHRSVAASLLLQLDLLMDPRRRSIYREEAVEALVEALTSTEWPCPKEAATSLISLGGRFSYSGKPMMEAWLLKTAGLEKSFLSFIKDELESSENSPSRPEDEEKAARVWERRVAGALVCHDGGSLIEALGQGIQSKNPGVSKPCMVVATWLTHLLPVLPDTGIRQTARNCLLDHFVGVLQSSKELHQRVLAALAIHSFISDPEGVQELLSYVKDISGPLRQLKRSTWVAREILRTFTTHGDVNSPGLWMHAEQGQLDTSAHGEVRALVRAKNRIFSGHSDGAIKVWDSKKRFPVLLQEHKEHMKSVTALTVSLNADRLYSGSLDKSIRVWALGAEDIHCVHVFELKDAIVGLLVNGPMACIIPQGMGIKVQYEDTATKVLNSNKHVQSLAISDGKIFCGCTDNSIQELNPITGSVDSIQHGVRTLLGKKSIYSIQVFQGYLYVAGSPVEGIAGKVWKLSDYSLVGTLYSTAEVRSMAVSEDFIYLGSNLGIIEVWLRERLLKVSTLNAGSKVLSLMLDGDTLYSGSEDGKIRVWAMT